MNFPKLGFTLCEFFLVAFCGGDHSRARPLTSVPPPRPLTSALSPDLCPPLFSVFPAPDPPQGGGQCRRRFRHRLLRRGRHQGHQGEDAFAPLSCMPSRSPAVLSHPLIRCSLVPSALFAHLLLSHLVHLALLHSVPSPHVLPSFIHLLCAQSAHRPFLPPSASNVVFALPLGVLNPFGSVRLYQHGTEFCEVHRNFLCRYITVAHG